MASPGAVAIGADDRSYVAWTVTASSTTVFDDGAASTTWVAPDDQAPAVLAQVSGDHFPWSLRFESPGVNTGVFVSAVAAPRESGDTGPVALLGELTKATPLVLRQDDFATTTTPSLAPGTSRIFLQTLSTDGLPGWTASIASDDSTRPVDCAVSNTSVAMVAKVSSGADATIRDGLGNQQVVVALEPTGGNSDTLIASFHSDGALRFVKRLLPTRIDGRLVADHDGGLTFASTFEDTIGLGDGLELTTLLPGKRALFAGQWDASGTLVWGGRCSRDISGDASLLGLVVSPSGGIVIAGGGTGELPIGAATVTTHQPMVTDGFVSRLGSGGGLACAGRP